MAVRSRMMNPHEADALADAKAQRHSAVAVRSRADLPVFPRDCTVELFYAEEEVFQGLMDDLLRLNHTALLLKCGALGAPTEVTLEFFGISFGRDVILPHILYNEQGTTLEWHNTTMLTCQHAINPSGERWGKGVHKVGVARGDCVNAFFDWAVSYPSLHPGYQLWDVWGAEEGSHATWVRASKCCEFVEDSLFKLHELDGAQLRTDQTLLRNYTPLLAEGCPEPVDMAVAEEAAAVVRHFETLTELAETFKGPRGFGGLSLADMLKALASKLESWYVYDRPRDLYLKVVLVPPYMHLDQLYLPMAQPWRSDHVASAHEEASDSSASAPADAKAMLTGMWRNATSELKERLPSVLIEEQPRLRFIRPLATCLVLSLVAGAAVLAATAGGGASLIFIGGALIGALTLPAVLAAMMLNKPSPWKRL